MSGSPTPRRCRSRWQPARHWLMSVSPRPPTTSPRPVSTSPPRPSRTRWRGRSARPRKRWPRPTHRGSPVISARRGQGLQISARRSRRRVAQRYWPDGDDPQILYHPSRPGFEAKIAERQADRRRDPRQGHAMRRLRAGSVWRLAAVTPVRHHCLNEHFDLSRRPRHTTAAQSTTTAASTTTAPPTTTTLAPLEALELVTVAEGLTQPVLLLSPPNDERRFVVERTGVVSILNADGSVANRFSTCATGSTAVGSNRACSVWPFTPTSPTTAGSSSTTTNRGPSRPGCRSSRSRSDASLADPASERELLTFDKPTTRHNGGMLQFGPTGTCGCRWAKGARPRSTRRIRSGCCLRSCASMSTDG